MEGELTPVIDFGFAHQSFCTEAVILVPKARGNRRLARANQGSLLYGYFSLSAKPPEMCGGEKLFALGRIRTYNLQNEPADSKH